MNTVVGTITLDGNDLVSEEFDFDIVEALEKSGNKTFYFFGETECKTSDDFLTESKNFLGGILNYDISISSEENVFLDPFDYEEGIYEVASFEGEQVTFGEIKNRFGEVKEVMSIRECEVSKRFGNRIIRVDFVY
ncbi:hypothetical protein LR004_01750 [Candidatus Gracilibacteria bacterium]|nr:hypothetical protein [Candidatus Gracilibacteria bacterium]